MCDFSLYGRVDGLKISSYLRKTFAYVFIVLFLSIVILDLDRAFLVTRSWYTDEVVLFVHVFIHSYHRYLLARLLCTRHCAGHLGCSREQKKLIPIL